MLTAIVGTAILLLCLAVVVAMARDAGPSIDEVATSYELAWDRLDFESLWALSGSELRDGRSRPDYVRAKRAAYAQQPGLGRLAARVVVEDHAEVGSSAVVLTRVDLHDGSVVHNRVTLERRIGRWQVVGYELSPAAPVAPDVPDA